MKTYGYFSKILNDYVKQEIKEIMSKEIFKVGDKVYHIEYGWGEVIEINDSRKYGLEVQFKEKSLDCTTTYTLGGKEFRGSNQSLLSFTEYTLEGFTQERPIELPDVGELCLVRDDESIHWRVREFAFEHNGTFYVKEPCGSTDSYIYMKRIKILD